MSKMPLSRKEFRKAKKEMKRNILLGFSGVCLVGATAIAFSSVDPHSEDNLQHGRFLAGSVSAWNKTEDCPEDQIYLLPYFLIILYAFFMLAIIVDDYFEPVLSTISTKLGLSEDVAGATFMAAGSSAPELLTSMMDAFVSKNSIGVGTIVGSAMFNILIIVALSAAVVKGSVKLDWRPLARDSIFYALSILLLTLFLINDVVNVVADEDATTIYNGTLEDFEEAGETGSFASGYGKIDTWEGVVMVVCYFGYIFFMIFNQRVFDWCARVTNMDVDEDDQEVFYVPPVRRHSIKRNIESFEDHKSSTNPNASADMESGIAQEEYKPLRNTRHSIKRALASYEDPEKFDTKPSAASIANGTSAIADKDDSASEASDNNSEYENPFAFPTNFVGRVWYITTLPINVAYYVTIPNTEKPRWENWYLASFFINILWIMGACFLMVTYATSIGCLLAVDPIVMGIVVLAAGTSVPDAIASMVVARQGFASMAIANALGSNVFDILLGLGLPWAIATAYFEVPTLVNNEGITVAILILLGTLVVFLVAIAVNKCYMNAKLGITFVVFYAVYLTYTIIAEQCLVPSISYKSCAAE